MPRGSTHAASNSANTSQPSDKENESGDKEGRSLATAATAPTSAKWLNKDYTPVLNQSGQLTRVLCDNEFRTDVRPVDVFLLLFLLDLIEDIVSN